MKPLLPEMMGEDYNKFFRTDEEPYTEEHFAHDEQIDNDTRDAKIGAI